MYKYLYNIIFIVFLCGASIQAFAQKKEGKTILGTVVDQKDHTPLNFASVVLLHVKDSSIINGGYTNSEGKFNFSVEEEDSLLLKISYIGYQGLYLPIFLKKQGETFDLGKINLVPTSRELGAVTVTAEKRPMYEYKKDSTIFNVPEGFEEGGTAQDVLEFTPSLTMDANDNIMVEGKGLSGVYIDNKPVSDLGFSAKEYLQNTPAFMIERVEILKTPPDPEDAAKAIVAGATDNYYLNIITRKIRYRGYNAALTAGANSRNEKTLRMRFNMNLKPFQLDYNNNLNGKTDSNYLHRTSFLKDDDSSVLDQQNYSKSMKFSQNLNARYTFQFTKKERLRLNARMGWSHNKNSSNDISNIVNPSKIPDQNRDQSNQRRSNGYNLSGNADYKKEYDKEGKELSASLNIRQRYNNNDRRSTGAYLLKGDTLLQQNKGNRESDGLRSHVQYKNSFGSENKHYYLLNGSFSASNSHNLSNASQSDTSTSSLVLHSNKRLSSNYFSDNKDYGVLFLIGKRDKKLGWATGTFLSYKDNNNHDDYRKSSVNSHVFSFRTGINMNYSFKEDHMLTLHLNPGFQRYEQNTIPNDSMDLISYKYTNFIPGASAKYEMGDHQVTFNYDRKLSMPNWRQLNPYVDNSDPLNIRTGNPDLRPTFTNEYRLGYRYSHKSFFASLRFGDRESKDVISSYTSVDEHGVSTRTYVNLNQRKSQSADFNTGFHYFKAIKDWDASVNLNASGGISAYAMQSDDEHVSKDFHDVSGITSNFKMWTSFKYKFFSIRVKGRYSGPRYFSQGKTPSRFNSGLRAKANFWKHTLSVSLGVENLFGASVKDNFYKTDRYIQYSNSRKNVRYFSLYITYQFKNYKKLGKEKG